MRRLLPGARVLLLLLLLPLLSCGGDDGTSPPITDDGPEVVAISLSASSASLLEPVEISGIPPGRKVHAVVTVDGSDDEGVATVEEIGGKYFMETALHPSDPIAGGDVNIRISDGKRLTSNEVQLTVGPLPAATEDVSDIITTLQEILTTWLVFTAQRATISKQR